MYASDPFHCEEKENMGSVLELDDDKIPIQMCLRQQNQPQECAMDPIKATDGGSRLCASILVVWLLE